MQSVGRFVCQTSAARAALPEAPAGVLSVDLSGYQRPAARAVSTAVRVVPAVYTAARGAYSLEPAVSIAGREAYNLVLAGVLYCLFRRN